LQTGWATALPALPLDYLRWSSTMLVILRKTASFLFVFTFTALISISVFSIPGVRADDAPAPPLVKQLNNGNWLDPKEAESLRDETARHPRLLHHAARAERHRHP
jgi:hypothetical protein